MDQKKIWEYFQNSEEHGDAAFNARARYEFIAKHVASGTHVLNIGVGRGGLEGILVQNHVVVSCLDPSEAAINRLRALYNLGERAQAGSAENIPFPVSHFDTVIMSEVLEHLSSEAISLTLKEIWRVLKPGGDFVGTVPADERLHDNHVICPHCGEPFHRWGHLQRFDKVQLRTVLGEQFKKVEVTRHYFGNVRSLNWKGRILWALKKLALSLRLSGTGETYFFRARKR